MSDTPNNTESKSWLEHLKSAFTHEPQNKEELTETLHTAAENNLIDKDSLNMIDGVMNVSNMTAEDIMIPRSQMIVLELGMILKEVLPIVIDSAHSRFPVIGENKDDVIGILLAKDLLKLFSTDIDENTQLDASILRPAGFIPESKHLDALLKEFRSSRDHMAIVVDEYGGVSGVVTIEDVLEEIVGDIEDEFDTEDNLNIKEISENRFLILALTEVQEFNTHFNCKLPHDTVDTIGGLITQSAGQVPIRGDTLAIQNFEFTVLEADTRKVQKLEARKIT